MNSFFRCAGAFSFLADNPACFFCTKPSFSFGVTRHISGFFSLPKSHLFFFFSPGGERFSQSPPSPFLFIRKTPCVPPGTQFSLIYPPVNVFPLLDEIREALCELVTPLFPQILAMAFSRVSAFPGSFFREVFSGSGTFRPS